MRNHLFVIICALPMLVLATEVRADHRDSWLEFLFEMTSATTSSSTELTRHDRHDNDRDRSEALLVNYVDRNYSELMRDAAVGEGEYLAGFASLLGCAAEDHGRVFRQARRGHSEIFGSKRSAPETLRSARRVIRRDAGLVPRCPRLVAAVPSPPGP